MATDGMSLTWSPRSNVFLYGGGVDLTKTTDIPLAVAHGLNISIAPDWSIGGSQNVLDELRFAHLVDETEWGMLSSADPLRHGDEEPCQGARALRHASGCSRWGCGRTSP